MSGWSPETVGRLVVGCLALACLVGALVAGLTPLFGLRRFWARLSDTERRARAVAAWLGLALGGISLYATLLWFDQALLGGALLGGHARRWQVDTLVWFYVALLTWIGVAVWRWR